MAFWRDKPIACSSCANELKQMRSFAEYIQICHMRQLCVGEELQMHARP